jgi:hypothetical protein
VKRGKPEFNFCRFNAKDFIAPFGWLKVRCKAQIYSPIVM